MIRLETSDSDYLEFSSCILGNESLKISKPFKGMVTEER